MSSAVLVRMDGGRDARTPVDVGMLTVDAPAGRAVRFLDAPLAADADEPFLWTPPEGDPDGWTFAGRGVAGRVDAEGRDRCALVRERARALLATVRGATLDGDPPVRLFGGFAFRCGERDPEWSAFGDASFRLPRFLYAEKGGRAWLRACVPLDAPRALESAVPALYRLRAFLAAPAPEPPRPAARGVREASRESWDARVDAALRAVESDRLAKVVLARRTRVELSETPSASSIAAALPAAGATRFLFGRDRALFAGATPERLVSLANGRLRCDALGGSAPRGADPASEALALLASAKDGREHAAVVAGIRAALAPLATDLCADGPRVRTLATVHHLHTEIAGRARPEVDVLALLEALHPTPAVCGEPREEAMRWISSEEGAPRGWYAGPVGWVDATGEGAFAVALRCALVRERDAWLYAGAGLVAGSDAAAEWRETAAKQAPMLRALGVSP